MLSFYLHFLFWNHFSLYILIKHYQKLVSVNILNLKTRLFSCFRCLLYFWGYKRCRHVATMGQGTIVPPPNRIAPTKLLENFKISYRKWQYLYGDLVETLKYKKYIVKFRGPRPRTLFYFLIITLSSIGMGRLGPKWPLDSDVIWQHLTICSDESSIVWPKSTYSYYK